ncbi:MAG TPA: adenosine deaminase, partial [Candidatus Desulfofervidus auxilii]|nr:adenosine deaminase [Candidatus Desulfofervidus auxilii]
MAEEIVDFFTGKKLPDTDMERLRQKVGRFLVEEKGYDKSDIEINIIFETIANEKKIVIPIDYIIRLKGKRLILIKCFPTALITREKVTLACARLLDNYPIPLTVITD